MKDMLIMSTNIIFHLQLWTVFVIKDLSVVFDSELSFVSHCKEKINRAYSMLGLIKRNFYIFNKRDICYTI